jgi:hypothetical protein
MRQPPMRTTVTPITLPMATAIMAILQAMVCPDMEPTLPHMAATPSRIALDAFVRTIRQARRIFRTVVSGFRAHSENAV